MTTETIEEKIDDIKCCISELILNISSNNVFDATAKINSKFDDILDMVRRIEEDRRWCVSKYLEKKIK